MDFPRRGGAQGRSRTTDTAIFSRVLYQLSYLGPTTAWKARYTENRPPGPGRPGACECFHARRAWSVMRGPDPASHAPEREIAGSSPLLSGHGCAVVSSCHPGTARRRGIRDPGTRNFAWASAGVDRKRDV